MPRFRRLFRFPWRTNQQIDADLDAEVRFHLDMRTEELIDQGVAPAAAREQARRGFGNVEETRRYCRSLDQRLERQTGWRMWLDELRHDVRYGARLLAKHPGFTTVAVLSLALGIGATSTIFSVLNAVVLRPLPFEEPDRLVAIRGFGSFSDVAVNERQSIHPFVSNFLAWREQSQTLEQIALGMGRGLTVPVSAGGGTARVQRHQVGAHLFRLLGVEPVLGRWFTAEDFPSGRGNSTTVIISFSLWQQLFGGDPAALGQALTQATGQTRTIVGVMPPGFRVLPQSGTTAHHAWVGREAVRGSGRVMGRLKRGVSVEQAQAELQTISRGLALDAGTEDRPWQVQVEPLDQWLSVDYAGTLYVLFGAVGCVLLIACLNVATLSLGRAAARRKEMATRLALGAGRLRVVRQLLTESLLLALLGGVLGVGLAVAGLKLFIALAAGWYPPTDEIGVDGTVLGFLLGLSLVTGIVSGVVPALRSSAVNLTDALKAGAQGALGGGGASPRQRRLGGVGSGAGARPAGRGGAHAEQLRSARARRSRLSVRPPLDDQVRSTTREVYERISLPVHAQRGRCAAAVPRAHRSPARGRRRRAGLRGGVSGPGEYPWASRGGARPPHAIPALEERLR